jgi:glycerol-3-phosphate dehydrogenase (NAD(P)+)
MSNMPDGFDIGVVGAGSWGTALANLLAEKGYPIDLWVFEQEICRQIAETRENGVFLPGIQLSNNLRPSTDLAEVVRGKGLVLIVVPSHVMRVVAGRMAPDLEPEAIVVSASKGIENETLLTMSGVLKEAAAGLSDDRLAVLSGPSFAREVAMGVPTVVTVASRQEACARKV